MRKMWPVLMVLSLGGGFPLAEELIFDASAVMKEVQRIATQRLWPGFNPTMIPGAIFDGENTYLFRFPGTPEGFTQVEGRPGVLVYGGKHPQVVGNRRFKLEGTWTASTVLREHSRLTGASYTDLERAAILVHEMFHVFQALRHEDWRPNEAILFGYPMDTVERLILRRKEMGAFVKALEAENKETVTGWAAAALRYREERFSLLDPAARDYENELQRFEGLADYVERKAANKPLASDAKYKDFSPGVNRDLGYLEGRWMAALLDRLDPGWKTNLEEGPSGYLEGLLSRACAKAPPGGFSKLDSGPLEEKAREDFREWQKERSELQDEFGDRAGYRIVIDAQNQPLGLTTFMATHSEAMAPGKLLHHRLFGARNSAGSLLVRRHDCVSISDGPSAIVKVIIPGLPSKPEITRSGQGASFEIEGIKIDFGRTVLSESARTLVIKLSEPLEEPSDSSAPP